MSGYKLVPMEPMAEMVEAAKDAYMPFGDMDLAIRMAILTAPDVQGEPVAYLRKDQLRQVQRMGPMLGEIADSPRADRVPVYAARGPAEQNPDVTHMVEALDCILSMDDKINIVDVMDPKAREMVEIARDALAAYRKGGE